MTPAAATLSNPAAAGVKFLRRNCKTLPPPGVKCGRHIHFGGVPKILAPDNCSTVAVVCSISDVPVLRWAALLHDIGKPSCFSIADDGVGHFYGHAHQSGELSESILKRLRFDTASRERIVQLVRYHDLPIEPERKQVKRLMNKLGADTVRQLIALHQADTLGQSAMCRSRIADYQEVANVLDEILREEDCFSLKDLAVNGTDMIALGFSGKQIGCVLNACLAVVMDDQIPNERALLLTYAKQIKF